MNEIIKHVPKIISVLTNPIDLWVNIGFAVVTFFAVMVALFQERIRKFWNRSILDMEINLVQPDCHKISLTDREGKFAGNSIYIRIKVKHKSGAAGENVEIIPVDFEQIDKDGKLIKVKYFLPISLAWSHFQPRTNLMRVPVGLFRYCDFGSFRKFPSSGKAMLVLDTIVQPNPVADGEIPNIIKSGKYQFELLLSGDNVKAIRKKWELEFHLWSEDEQEMLDKNIKIKEIK